VSRILGFALALVLALGPLWGTCAACSPAKQEPVGEHDCCKPVSHHQSGPRDSKPCPHAQFAPQDYEKVDQSETTVPVIAVAAEVPSPDSLPASPDSGEAIDVLPDTHAPPGLYLRISVIRV
jgi:hypothetical protein